MEHKECEQKTEIARLDAAAQDANALIDQMEHSAVKTYFKLGRLLLQLRPHFPGQWEKHLKELGIDETEMEPTTPPITVEELAAVNIYVKAVGGWERAICIIEECYQKWNENQNG
jgi:hypothetical protein